MNEPQPPQSAPRPPADLNPRDDPPLDFPDRDLGELTPADYATLGFMCGLEVHQQLRTRSKLFCRCPAGVSSDRVDAEVLRHMRPTLSELGEYDGCALMEFKTRKEIVYRLERSSVCTYEIDDTPPFPIDEEAVLIALEIARLYRLDLVSELHVMRKQYLDGSIPTGFQRTAMVGLAGTIPFRDGQGAARELRIRQLSLEEDSCREVSDLGHRITFRTDRLGVPLTETVTEPELLTPDDVRAAGGLIADVARATHKVRRGPGAARQDVNVSVAGGRRVEIKGVCHHRGLPLLVHVEAFRQLNLLRIREELRRRGVIAAHLALPDAGPPWERSPLAVDARRLVRRSAFEPLRDALERGDMVSAVRLPGFRGLLNHRTQPGITFAREIADRVRVIACLRSQPFMLHSDVKDSGYGLVGSQWKQLRSASRAEAGDALVLLWGEEADVATAVREVLARAAEALIGVPAETRQAFGDGTTGFERILPGPDRMYPDTDTPPLPIPDRWVERVERALPERPWERAARYGAAGLGEAAARELAVAPWADLLDELSPKTPVALARIAGALRTRLVFWWREARTRALPSAARLAPLVAALDAAPEGPLAHATNEILDRILREPDRDAAAIVAEHRGGGDVERRLESLIARVATARAEVFDADEADEAAILRWAMGEVMRPLLGRVHPERARERLRAALGFARPESSAEPSAETRTA